MALPSPAQLAVEVEEIREGLSRMLDDYRWGHGVLYNLRGQQPETGGEETALGKKTATAARGDVAFSDPVGDAATTRDRVRSNLGQAAGSVQRIGRQVDSGLEALGRIFTDRRERYERLPGGEPSRMVTRADLEKSHKAKERRVARGDNWGEG